MSTLSAISFILFIICFVLTIVFAISEYKKNKNIQRNVPTNQNAYSRTATRASRRRPKKSWKLTIRFLVATIAFFTLSGIFANRAAESYSSSDDTSSDVNKSEPKNPKIKKAPAPKKSDVSGDTDTDSSSTQEKPFNANDYDANVSYDDLARNPDSHKGSNLSYSGTIIQVIENDNSVTIRFAVADDYDSIIMVEVPNKILDGSHLLEDDSATIYGKSLGTVQYESTMGGDITVPHIKAAKVEDYGKKSDSNE